MPGPTPLDAAFLARAVECLGRGGALVIEANDSWPWRAYWRRPGLATVWGYGPDPAAALARLAGLAGVAIPVSGPAPADRGRSP